MITTSDKYKTAISKSGRHFRLKIDIAGTAYTGIKSFKLKGGTNSSEQITFGDAVSSYIEFILTDVPKNTILKGRQAIPYIGLELDDGTVEWIKKGVYNLEKPVRSGEFIKLTAYDNFALCYKGFFTALSGNQKIAVILQEQCKKIGIEYAGGADDVIYKVDSLQGLTIIEAISVLAAYCGKNAIMDKDGKLRLVWYTDAGLTISPSRFADPLEMDEEDTFINRLDCTIDEEHSVSAGTGVGIYFSCPGMTQERIAVLHNRIKGFTYRAAKLNWRMAQPDVEAGDLVRVMDNAGNVYAIPLMDYEFNCDGGFYGTIQSKGKTEQEQDTGYKGPLQTKVDRTYSDLVSTKQVITDKITAFEGEFETINTNYLEVNKKLTALDAEIENLDVTELTAKVAIIETSYVSKEYVQDLYATKAEVHVLDVDLERVNTLLAGSVTAGSTQTIVLNADNTTISNALIKSAMIDSVAADKVTAGTIDASSIHFKSQSGRLDIFGETLQVKDATRTRVQIGKDGTGDYALSQWDAQGNLMWDSRGAKAAAIKDKIIVNDMVSDNAEIEGKKINITSLVKEINDGTEVIKSSHILVDGANQSLSVVYNTITGDLSTLSTALSVEQGKISSLITDVSQAKGDVSTLQTNYSSLTQTVSGINSTVGEHTSTLTSVTSKQTQLEQTVDGFSGRISAAESTALSTSSKLSSLVTDVNGFKTTVSDTYATKDIVNSMSSTITQKVDSLSVGIKESYNRINLIENSDFTNDTACWNKSLASTCTGGRATTWGSSTGRALWLESSAFDGTANNSWNQRIDIGRKVKGFYMSTEFLTNSDYVAGPTNPLATYIINIYYTDGTSSSGSVRDTSHKWVRVGKFVEVEDKEIEYVRVYLYGRDFKGRIAFNRPFLCEANSAAIDPSYWAPAQSEVTGNMSVVINHGGLRVNNGALSIYNNAGSRVLYGDTNGNLTMTGTVTATSGKIGGFDIGALRLSAQNNGKYTVMQSAGTYAFYAGSTAESMTGAPFYVTHEGKLKADNALLTGSFTSLGTENTKVVIGNGRMDLFINSNHCGGIASSYTSSTSRGILLSADTGAKFLSLGQTDIDGNSGASWYTLNFGLNPSGWTERHIFLGSSNFPVQPKNGKGYVVVSNVTGGGFRNIRQIYHGHPDSSTDYLQYEDVTGADYYCKTSWVSDAKLKANIMDTDVCGIDAIRRFKHESYIFKKTGFQRSIGYIAQNLQEIDPQLVENLGGTLAINPEVVIPYISKAVQELDTKIACAEQNYLQNTQNIQQELQKRDFEISQLQHRIQQLESRS
ncbi:Chaperone of endosialidase [[Clostridium] innocuum]|uniref:tail fiber domain-containing protein n=1 Tax=Clostridium innocuum TaxID=1522 RepID=UPI0008EB4AF8|nr:tail fiber domain-containing protein [[Clostridium] innocuum]SFL19626.1 Chaperone of endosialidase [[Clostridium] innocuum]